MDSYYSSLLFSSYGKQPSLVNQPKNDQFFWKSMLKNRINQTSYLQYTQHQDDMLKHVQKHMFINTNQNIPFPFPFKPRRVKNEDVLIMYNCTNKCCLSGLSDEYIKKSITCLKRFPIAAIAEKGCCQPFIIHFDKKPCQNLCIWLEMMDNCDHEDKEDSYCLGVYENTVVYCKRKQENKKYCKFGIYDQNDKRINNLKNIYYNTVYKLKKCHLDNVGSTKCYDKWIFKPYDHCK